jgi:uncharacterized protein YydD (DUF2326 family)
MEIQELDSSIDTFKKIKFKPGLNLVLGERSEGNKTTSGHNVGKTSFIKILEYLLFFKKDKTYFDGWLKKFEGDEFSLYIKNIDEVTIIELPINMRLQKTNLGLSFGEKYSELGFLLRYRQEYNDEFRRPTYVGKDINWKPFVFSVLGFSPDVMKNKMQADIDYQNTDNVIKAIEIAALKDSDKTEQIDKLTDEANLLKEAMSKLDFFHYDKKLFSEKLVYLDNQYSSIKTNIYRLENSKTIAEGSLKNQSESKFNIDEIDKIFKESKIVLALDIKHSYEELIEFNHQITDSRRNMLLEVIGEINLQLTSQYSQLKNISLLRTKYNNILARKDYKETYESYQGRLIDIEKEIGVLGVQVMKKSKEEFIEKKNILENEVANSRIKLRNEQEKSNNKFDSIKYYYSYLLKKILNVNSIIELIENSNCNIDFRTSIKDADIDMLGLNGEVFRRISCGVLDMAIAASSPGEKPIIIHDGLIDGIAAPIKRKYLFIASAFCSIKNIQYILTGINEGIPLPINRKNVIRTLTDKPESELLFGIKF